MYLTHLSLNDFRNYTQLDLSLGPGLFIFCGENAQGKTNLLEAISMLATASSFHASSDREVVAWSAAEPIARLNGRVHRQQDEVQVEIIIVDPTPTSTPTTGQPTTVRTRSLELPANAPRKRYKVNGAPKKTTDVIGQLRTVLFAPADLHLVDGSPDERRRYLDRALCQVNPRYCQALLAYRKIVTQRSALLKRIRDFNEDPQLLHYLDEQLVKLATQIMYERQRMIGFLNQHASVFQEAISGGREQLQIVYRSSFEHNEQWSLIEAERQYYQQLQALRKREIIQGVCLRGPHRDDVEFLVNGINMLTYGSRGQQRTSALAAKFSELAYMRACTGEEPVLLLDDVFSELDITRRDYLLSQIVQYHQVFLTMTDLQNIPSELLAQAHIYRVVNGTIHEQSLSL